MQHNAIDISKLLWNEVSDRVFKIRTSPLPSSGVAQDDTITLLEIGGIGKGNWWPESPWPDCEYI